MNEVVPDLDDDVPEDNEAEPEDADIEHGMDPDEILALLDEDEDET